MDFNARDQGARHLASFPIHLSVKPLLKTRHSRPVDLAEIGMQQRRRLTCPRYHPTMLKPPLTLITCPVIQDPPGDARCTTVGATSSGRPSRRSG